MSLHSLPLRPPLTIAARMRVSSLPDAPDAIPAFVARLFRCGMDAVAVEGGNAAERDRIAEACRAQGIALLPEVRPPFLTNADEAWRTLGEGAATLVFDDLFDAAGRPDPAFFDARRVVLFARAFSAILCDGKIERDLAAVRGGLRAHETRTPQNGGIVWIENPDREKTVTGSFFPYLPEITLPPGACFPYVHDAPIGAGATYLGAYGGLVKSDAYVLSTHILPDPHDGIRVYVYGPLGETREVALWSGNDRGVGVDVVFAPTPRVYVAGTSQIVALPVELAGRTWTSDDAANAPVLIGPDMVWERDAVRALVEAPPNQTHTFWSLDSEGALNELNVAFPPVAADSDGAFDASRGRALIIAL